MENRNEENEGQINPEECCCHHGEEDFKEFEKDSTGIVFNGTECRHEKVVPVMSWKKEDAR